MHIFWYFYCRFPIMVDYFLHKMRTMQLLASRCVSWFSKLGNISTTSSLFIIYHTPFHYEIFHIWPTNIIEHSHFSVQKLLCSKSEKYKPISFISTILIDVNCTYILLCHQQYLSTCQIFHGESSKNRKSMIKNNQT